jgi:putative SOS response-associated peptidase YedK
MCFNAALVQTAEIIEEFYGAVFPSEKFDTPAFFKSAFEHPRWPILKQSGHDRFVPALWGLIPSWIKTADDASSIRDKTLNARFETIDTKPSFRALVDRNRCGVLIDGFVEWRSYQGRKYPYHIALEDKRPFLLAGLWDRWQDPSSDTELETFTVVTVEAAGLPAQIHNTKLRMPFILTKESGRAWLNTEVPYNDCVSLMAPFYKTLQAWPVGKAVSMPGAAKDIPEIQDIHAYPELQPLNPI